MNSQTVASLRGRHWEDLSGRHRAVVISLDAPLYYVATALMAVALAASGLLHGDPTWQR